jgi:hypothetical protein
LLKGKSEYSNYGLTVVELEMNHCHTLVLQITDNAEKKVRAEMR